MRLELIVEETLERVLGDLEPPPIDPVEIRRAAKVPRRAMLTLVVVIVLLVGSLGATMLHREEPSQQRAVDPGTLPVMDFAPGLRGYFEEAGSRVHLGGQTFKTVRDLDAGATVTPHGLLYFADDQSVRLLNMAGEVQTLASASADPQPFTPTARFDIYSPRVAWATRSGDEVSVSVYEFGLDPGLVGSFPVPCEGASCEQVTVVGFDLGLVFIHRPGATMVLVPDNGPDAKWETVSAAQVVDVRTKTLLTLNGDPTAVLAAPLDSTWRIAPTSDPAARLTFDASRQLSVTTTLEPTINGVAPLPLQVPRGKATTTDTVALDSDGTVLVARQGSAGGHWIWDCDLNGVCVEINRLPPAQGTPTFLGIPTT